MIRKFLYIAISLMILAIPSIDTYPVIQETETGILYEYSELGTMYSFYTTTLEVCESYLADLDINGNPYPNGNTTIYATYSIDQNGNVFCYDMEKSNYGDIHTVIMNTNGTDDITDDSVVDVVSITKAN